MVGTDSTNPISSSAARIGGSVWVWPIAAAVLAAWPVWRSFFAEVPDIGAPPLRGQVLAALGQLVLVGLWIPRFRERVTGFVLPLLAIGFAVVVLIMAGTHGDAPTVDLAALAICWLAVVFLFAGAVLLEGQRAFATLQGGAVPRVSMLLRATAPTANRPDTTRLPLPLRALWRDRALVLRAMDPLFLVDLISEGRREAQGLWPDNRQDNAGQHRAGHRQDQ